LNAISWKLFYWNGYDIIVLKIELGHRKGIKKHRKNLSLKNSQNWQKDLGCRLCDKLSQSSAFQQKCERSGGTTFWMFDHFIRLWRQFILTQWFRKKVLFLEKGFLPDSSFNDIQHNNSKHFASFILHFRLLKLW